ncbi:CU044_5270 family protein [Frondihabitans cladoniiphilus]|uniref:CU044_5270 family protein n=1 Tax=Frondihabitans cladoniiphilus TaxID=715785 RepID=A0ABP8VND8_9MICO
MDELTLLRKVRSQPTGPTDEALLNGRARLVEHLAWETASSPMAKTAPAKAVPVKTHRGMHTAGWITATGLVAAGVATALVLGNVVGLAGWRGGADAAAADTLDQAAAAAIATSDPVVAPGQYLEVATHAAYAAYVPVPGASSDAQDTVYLESQDGQMYVPADTSQDWVWVRDSGKPVQTFGADSERAAAADTGDTDETVHGVGGAFYGSPADVTPAKLAALPTDPTQLLNEIYRTTLGQGQSRDGEALVWIADTLRSGIVPAAVRASLYKAAALIPGVTLTPGAANLDGRTGVAIGRDEGDGTRQEIIIDPATGLVIGEREVLLKDLGEMPAGTSMGWTAVTTSVVDALPAGVAK